MSTRDLDDDDGSYVDFYDQAWYCVHQGDRVRVAQGWGRATPLTDGRIWIDFERAAGGDVVHSSRVVDIILEIRR